MDHTLVPHERTLKEDLEDLLQAFPSLQDFTQAPYAHEVAVDEVGEWDVEDWYDDLEVHETTDQTLQDPPTSSPILRSRLSNATELKSYVIDLTLSLRFQVLRQAFRPYAELDKDFRIRPWTR